MKHAKRAVAFLAAVLLVMMMAGTALASGGQYNVWIDVPEDSGTSDTLVVPVRTDGTATDGLTVITYDPSVLSVSEQDVSKDKAVMYSANAAEAGTLKISWIAGDAPENGVLLNVTFHVLKQGAEMDLSMSGEAFSGDPGLGEDSSVPVGDVTPSPEPTPEASPEPSPEASPEASPVTTDAPGTTTAPTDSGAKAPGTGDSAAPALWAAAAAVCAAGAVFCARRLRKSGN